MQMPEAARSKTERSFYPVDPSVFLLTSHRREQEDRFDNARLFGRWWWFSLDRAGFYQDGFERSLTAVSCLREASPGARLVTFTTRIGRKGGACRDMFDEHHLAVSGLVKACFTANASRCAGAAADSFLG
jgi:hypothetical protein